jgi:hypothetical protein
MIQTQKGLIVNAVTTANKEIQVILPSGSINPFAAFVTLKDSGCNYSNNV